MKYWLLIVILILATIAIIAGATMKIMHWPHHRLFYLAGLSGVAVSLILLVIKLSGTKNGESNEN